MVNRCPTEQQPGWVPQNEARLNHFETSCSNVCLTCLMKAYTSLVSFSSSSSMGRFGRKGLDVGTTWSEVNSRVQGDYQALTFV